MWNARKLAAAHAARFEWKRSAEQRSASERKYEWLDTYISGSQPTVLGLLEVELDVRVVEGPLKGAVAADGALKGRRKEHYQVE